MNEHPPGLPLTAGIDAYQSRDQRRAEVARDVIAAAFTRGNFTMPNGEHTTFYFDKHLFLTKPTILRRLSNLMADMIAFDVDRLVAAEEDALILASALSVETGLPLVALSRINSPGDTVGVHGEIHPNERMLIVADVVASGDTALRIIEELRSAGISEISVLTVVDRQEGAGSRLASAGVGLDPLFTLDELRLDPLHQGPIGEISAEADR